jgi:N-acetylneuraminic acid mutarotase
MKKVNLLLIFFLLVSTTFSQKWFNLNDFSGSKRSRTSGFSVGSKGYLLFGKQGGQEFKELYEYTPSSDTWVLKSPFPGVGRYNAFAFDIDSFAYAGGGYTGSSSTYDFYQYNPKTDVWTLRMPYPGSNAVANIAIGLNGKGYVGGGTTVNSTPSSIEFYEYNPQTNTWTAKANLPFGARTGAITFALNGLIFTGLGHNGGTNFNDLWAYNPANNLWTQKTNFPGTPRIQSSVFIIDGKVLVGGGHQFSNSTPFLDYYIYNDSNDSWSSLLQLNAGPSNSTGADFTVNNIGYLACGFDSTLGDTKKVWALKPVPTSVRANSPNEKSISIYPNPTSSFISVNTRVSGNLKSQYVIYNHSGKQILKGSLSSNDGQIDCSQLPVGSYFLHLFSGGQRNTGKFIVIN